MLTKKIEQGYEIILMLDANASSSEYKDVTRTLQKRCNLEIIAPNDVSGNLNSHNRGIKQINLVMSIRTIKQALCHSTVKSFDEVCNSDHRSLVIDIKTDHLNHQEQHNNRTIGLLTKKPSRVKLYK